MPIRNGLRKSTSAINSVRLEPQAYEREALVSDIRPANAGVKTSQSRDKHQAQSNTAPSKRTRSPTPGAERRTSRKFGRSLTPSPTAHSTQGFVPGQNSPSLDRPAEPHRTNAPVVTPHGSRLTNFSTNTFDETPSKTGMPRPTTTTGVLLEEACAHLISIEPKLQPLIERHYCHVFCPEGLSETCNPFKSLCATIMGQQVRIKI